MKKYSVIRIWVSASVVLLSYWLADAKSSGKRLKANRTSKDLKFNYGIQYGEAQTKVVYTTTGNSNHAPCVFPFMYNKTYYMECTKKGCKHNKPWCGTTANYDKDKKWGHCVTDDDVKSCNDRHSRCGQWAVNGECVVNNDFMRKVCPRSCGLCTHGGNGQGMTCVFPFFYKDRIVRECLHFNKMRWCAVTTNYNKDRIWGYCFPKLYRNLSDVNKRFLKWGECDDLSDNCKQWAGKGECKKSVSYMEEKCPWSCHKCAPALLVVHDGCKDHSSMCAQWAQKGDCTDCPVFMYSFCRWTCRLCAQPSKRISVYDEMPNCEEWAKNGDCLTKQEFMLQNCRKSCRAGGYVNGKVCLDDDANCNSWADRGLCREPTTRDCMMETCRFSCRLCR